MEEVSRDPFAPTLRRLLERNGFVTGTGGLNYSAFARALPALHIQELRNLVAGRRVIRVDHIEQIAQALDVPPGYFAEYRILKAARFFDVSQVGFARAREEADSWWAERLGG